MVSNLPIKKWRAGSIDGAIWINKREINGDKVEIKSASLRRSWKDKEKDIWREEKLNLRRNDIPKVIVILNKIQEELFLNKEMGMSDDESDEE